MADVRKVVVTGSLRIVNLNIGDDVIGRLDISAEGEVSLSQPSVRIVDHSTNGSQCVGEELRLEIDLDAIYESEEFVRINGVARLYEGTTCETQEEGGRQKIDFIVPRDGTQTQSINVVNTEPFGGDYVEGTLTFSNTIPALVKGSL